MKKDWRLLISLRATNNRVRMSLAETPSAPKRYLVES